MHQRPYMPCKAKNIHYAPTPLQKFADCCSGQYQHPETLTPRPQQQNMHLLCLPGLLLPLLGWFLFLCHFLFILLLFIVQSGKFILRLTEKTARPMKRPNLWDPAPPPANYSLTLAFPFDFSSFSFLPLSPGCGSSDTAWRRHTYIHTQINLLSCCFTGISRESRTRS